MTSFNSKRVKKLQIIEIAEFILTTKCTVREAAKKFNLSKTTIHRYMVEDLPECSIGLARKIRKILDYNKLARHMRGGMATKLKYKNLKNNK